MVKPVLSLNDVNRPWRDHPERRLTRRERLNGEIHSWRLAQEIRAYFEASHAADESVRGGDREWLAWIAQHADSIDPLTP